jgi:hypothetical protein
MSTASESRVETYIDPDDKQKGRIQYRFKHTEPLKGLFSSTYYFGRDFKGQDNPWSKLDVYKAGILQYLKVTEAPEFAGWRVILYTDALSLERSDKIDQNMFVTPPPPEKLEQHRREWEEIKAHPNVVFAVVDWPEYAVGYGDDSKTIDNAILRALRLKAFHDFPKIPVFVRDADTLFENLVRVGSIVPELVRWEATLWENLKKIFTPDKDYRILVASQPSYQRQWHVHPDTGVKTTGCYAALTSSLGGMPEWTDGSLWRKCLEYLRAHTKIVRHPSGERVPNNLGKPTYIGKDEQLLSYVVLLEAFKRVYFYYLEYIHVEGTKVEKTEDAPFAQALLDVGYVRYPSPYKTVLGEPELPLDQPTPPKRKDENEKTERTILKAEIIPLALAPETQRLMEIVFRFYHEKIREAMAAPGFKPLQLGGAKASAEHTTRQSRKRRSRKTQVKTVRRRNR